MFFPRAFSERRSRSRKAASALRSVRDVAEGLIIAFTSGVGAIKIFFMSGGERSKEPAPVPFGGETAKLEAPTEITVTPNLPDASAWHLFEHTDLPGYDLPGMPLKLLAAEECKMACEGNDRCRAFTFNEVHHVCFLKGMATEALQFSGAVSGYKGLETDITRIGQDFGPSLSFRTSRDVEVLGKNFRQVLGYKSRCLSRSMHCDLILPSVQLLPEWHVCDAWCPEADAGKPVVRGGCKVRLRLQASASVMA
ncbi:hypothetical protein BN77_4194 [Rhizobium mesoamericanum STM3625]|uniref:Apple domain-containing protein n=1 Tax=Rhizobium mesoamericanum STM3625 TaxID=1211777 RepID=K0PTJ5_9HYPH|nr:hypothetical protein BN77_4194 [Rhizobium mesoamericanum STM3625]